MIPEIKKYHPIGWRGDIYHMQLVYVFKLIPWCLRKQVSKSLSSTDSKYVAISMVASEACWLINLLYDFDFLIGHSVTIYSNKKSAILVTCLDNVKRFKHTDIRFHFVKDLVQNNKICSNQRSR